MVDAQTFNAIQNVFDDGTDDAYKLCNFKNYFVYANDIQNRNNVIKVYVPDAINNQNIDDHIDGIYNILLDGCETDYIHSLRMHLIWPDANCHLSIVDYWYSLIMWYMLVQVETQIRPCHIFMGSRAEISAIARKSGKLVPWQLKRKDLQAWVNKFIITIDNEIKYGNDKLNHIIAQGLWKYSIIERFSYYLSNTINNEDNIELMLANHDFWNKMHFKLGNTPIEDAKDVAQAAADDAIAIIKDAEYYIGHEHSLTNSFRSSEAVNPRQYREACINIATKPDGNGGIFQYPIDTNFTVGGVNNPLYYFEESRTARVAQIYSKQNVGESGDLARILGLNNTDTIINNNPEYECLSSHFIKIELKSKKHLSMYKNRFFRFNPRGMDCCVDQNDQSLIGKTIYVHSPITCASNSSGKGICRRCYGNLYYTNYNINIGKIAAEMLSAQLTQTLLSAKHLLETRIAAIAWNTEFNDFFSIVDANCIRLAEEVLDDESLRKYMMIIDPDDVNLVNEEEDTIVTDSDDEEYIQDSGIYNEYITGFIIRTPDGVDISFGSAEQTELYISHELNNIIRKKALNTDGKVNIPLSALGDVPIFFIKINNNEISKTMDDIINVINKSSITEKMDKDQIVQNLVDLIIDGNLTIDAIHLEVILSNQCVNPDDLIHKPNWNDPNAKSKMITLNQALTNNPSVIISLLYKDLHKVLYNPLTFTKNAPSFFDLFFCEQPQNYMSDDLYTEDTTNINEVDTSITMMELTGEPTKEEKLMAKLEEIMKKEKEENENKKS